MIFEPLRHDTHDLAIHPSIGHCNPTSLFTTLTFHVSNISFETPNSCMPNYRQSSLSRIGLHGTQSAPTHAMGPKTAFSFSALPTCPLDSQVGTSSTFGVLTISPRLTVTPQCVGVLVKFSSIYRGEISGLGNSIPTFQVGCQLVVGAYLWHHSTISLLRIALTPSLSPAP